MLILLSMALAAPAAAPSQTAIDNNRKALVACLKQAASSAKPPQVTVDGFAAYAKQQCATQASGLQDSMVAFDVKNGVARASAAEGAGMAVDDYVETAKGNYQMKSEN